MTYGAPFFVTITRQITGKGPEKLQKLLGRLPIMVKVSSSNPKVISSKHSTKTLKVIKMSLKRTQTSRIS